MNIRKYRAVWAVTAVAVAFSSCGQADISGTAEVNAHETYADTKADMTLEREQATEKKTISKAEPAPAAASVTFPPCTCPSCTCMPSDTEDSKYEAEYVTLESPADDDLLDLANYPNLRSLRLVLPVPDDTDISLLNGLEGLEDITVIGSGSMDYLDRLYGIRLPGVKELSVWDCGYFEVSFITDCFPGLEYISVSGNHISGTEALGKLKNLKRLWIADCGINNIDFVKNLPGLEVLYAKDNNIVDISPLAGMNELYMLDISGNPVGDRAGETLKMLHSLTRLAADSCGISDLSFLSGCPEVEELSLSYNPISDITPVGGLEKLFEFSAGCALVENVEVLGGLSNLRYIVLEGDRITDMSPMAGCPEDCWIDVYGNPISHEDRDKFFEDNPGMRLWAPG